MFRAPILVAEATALCDGLKAATDVGFKQIQVEGDNQIVIQAVQGDIHIPSRTQKLVLDIRVILACFSSVSMYHIFRESNMAADWIATRGVLLKDDVTFLTSLSPKLSCIIRDYYASRILERRAT